MQPTLVLVLLISITIYFIFVTVTDSKIRPAPGYNDSNYCPILKNKPSNTSLTDIFGDIGIVPYGCFTNIKDEFFRSCINPYSKTKIPDGGIFISNYPQDMVQLINNVITNGYNLYGHNLMSKYSGTNYDNLHVQEIATLAKLNGYNYISIYEENENGTPAALNGGSTKKIFISYSPPMIDTQSSENVAKSDLPDYTLTPLLGKYRNEENTDKSLQLSCGYPCMSNGKPETFNKDGKEYQYMCGSTAYPSVKTPSRYAVYQIVELN